MLLSNCVYDFLTPEETRIIVALSTGINFGTVEFKVDEGV